MARQRVSLSGTPNTRALTRRDVIADRGNLFSRETAINIASQEKCRVSPETGGEVGTRGRGRPTTGNGVVAVVKKKGDPRRAAAAAAAAAEEWEREREREIGQERRVRRSFEGSLIKSRLVNGRCEVAGIDFKLNTPYLPGGRGT